MHQYSDVNCSLENGFLSIELTCKDPKNVNAFMAELDHIKKGLYRLYEDHHFSSIRKSIPTAPYTCRFVPEDKADGRKLFATYVFDTVLFEENLELESMIEGIFSVRLH